MFAPLYLYHRYQVDAAAKYVGGIRSMISYPLKDDALHSDVSRSAASGPVGNPTFGHWVTPDEQRRALASLLKTIDNDALAVPTRIRSQMVAPLDAGEPVMGRERLGSRLGPVFDHSQAAATAARITFNALLATPRLNRVEHSWSLTKTSDRFTVPELLQRTSETVFDDYADRTVGNAVRDEYLTKLFAVLHDGSAMAEVRADVLSELQRYQRRLARGDGAAAVFARRIERELARELTPADPAVTPAEIPPGSPIGQGTGDHDSCWHCDSAALLGL